MTKKKAEVAKKVVAKVTEVATSSAKPASETLAEDY